MNEIARRWRVLAGGMAAGVAAVVGFAGATASAEPVLPQPPLPMPVTVTQTVTVPPDAAATAAGPRPTRCDARHDRCRPAIAAPAVPAAAARHDHPAPARARLPTSSSRKGVKLEPQNSRDFKALNIVLPVPQGWTQVPDPNVPDAFAVIADRVGGNGLYTSNAQVVVYKLVGDFDPKEAISHGFIDSQQLPAWRATDASLADFGGMPSSIIEGTYRENNMTLNTSRRHVIATAGPGQVPGVAGGDHRASIRSSRRPMPPTPSSTDSRSSAPRASRHPHRHPRHRACPSLLRAAAQPALPQLPGQPGRRRPPGEAWRPRDGPSGGP